MYVLCFIGLVVLSLIRPGVTQCVPTSTLSDTCMRFVSYACTCLLQLQSSTNAQHVLVELSELT
jgi:hypothetical protein